MRLASRSLRTNVITVGLLFVSLFVSAADAYFCPDCSPRAFTFPAAQALPGSAPQQVLGNDESGGDQPCHSNICPVCLSLLLIGAADATTLISSVHGAFQDPPPLVPGVAATIYKPPRIAS